MEISITSPVTLQYIFKVSLFAAVLHLLFKWLVSNFPMHQFNRVFLLLGSFLAVLLPIFSIKTIANSDSYISNIISFKETTIKAIPSQPSIISTLNGYNIAVAIYISIAIILAILLVIKITKLVLLIKSSPKEKFKNYTIVQQQQISAGSFFNYVFVDKNQTHPNILNHELAHIMYKHSFDKLYLEIMLVLFWWCVPLYFIKKELLMIHEFQADNKAANDDKLDYSEFLVHSLFTVQSQPLINSFFHHPIQLRIKMLYYTLSAKNKIKKICSTGVIFSSLLLLFVLIQTVAFGNKPYQDVKNFLAAHANQVVPISIWYLTSESEEQDKIVEKIDLSTAQGRAKMKYYVDNNMVEVGNTISNDFGMLDAEMSFVATNPLCKQFWPADVYVSKGVPRKLIAGQLPPITEKQPVGIKNNLDINFFDEAEQVITKEKNKNNDPEDENPSIAIISKIANICVEKPVESMKITTKKGVDTLVYFTTDMIQPKDYDTSLQNNFPVFTTGEKGLQKFIIDNITYPTQAIKNKIEGKLLMEVTINPQGKVIAVSANKTADNILAAEAKRVLLLMPNWKVDQRFTGYNKNIVMLVPVSFVL